MGTLKDAYDILRDLIKEAKRLQNLEMISLSMDVQEKLFELREEMETLKDENKELKAQLEEAKNPKIKEEDIKYYSSGFFTLNSEGNHLPYCSACWKADKKLVPLSRHSQWWMYRCSKCQSQVTVMDENGAELK